VHFQSQFKKHMQHLKNIAKTKYLHSCKTSTIQNITIIMKYVFGAVHSYCFIHSLLNSLLLLGCRHIGRALSSRDLVFWIWWLRCHP